MGATNSTLNYQLSQFISTDKPAWLQDYNGDMEKIDVGINTAKVAADTAQNTANSAVSSIGTVSSDISALQTDVLAHTNDITDLQGDVNTIESLIGNGTPTTTDHTIIGAINEINAKETYSHIDISSSTKYSDVASYIEAAIASFKRPFIEATISYSAGGATYSFKGYLDLNAITSSSLFSFNCGYGRSTFDISIGASSTVINDSNTPQIVTGFSNAKLYY